MNAKIKNECIGIILAHYFNSWKVGDNCLMKDFEMHTLANGIRVIHKQVQNTKIVHCGYIFDIGSRDEKEEQQGIAHFWEHMAFKGTKKRKAFHILNRLDSVGGELNAYTTKEKICFYAVALENHFEMAFELLKDISFDSIFPENQIEKERKVILEEMSMYLDSPEDSILDDFDSLIYNGHSMAHNILGTRQSVLSFHKNDFDQFIRENHDNGRFIISVVGNIPFKKVVRIAEKHLASLPSYSSERDREHFTEYVPKTRLEKKSINQSHCVAGRTSYPITDERRLPFVLLNNILGGPGMNSKLNLGIREKYGFVYGIDANYSPFTDTGLFSVSFATDEKHLYRCVELVFKEFKRLKEKAFTELQLHRAKEQFIGQLAMAEENNTSLMLALGKSQLDLGYVEPLQAIFNKIRSIEALQLQDIANEMFNEEEMSFLYFKSNNA